VPLIVGEKQKQGEARRKERIEAAGARGASSRLSDFYNCIQ
jgi:hypothetical protein